MEKHLTNIEVIITKAINRPELNTRVLWALGNTDYRYF